MGTILGTPPKDGLGTEAVFGYPFALTVDTRGNLYVTDARSIRKITLEGLVSTLAGPTILGSGNGLSALNSITIDTSGNVYVTDTRSIRKITPQGQVTTIAGSTASGSADGLGPAASFSSPSGIAVDNGGNLYVPDTRRIRKITPEGLVSTLAGSAATGSTDGLGAAAIFTNLLAITIDSSGTLYVVDGQRIRKISPEGQVSTIQGYSSPFTSPWWGSITVDSSGNIFIVEGFRIRRLSPEGLATTFAGSGNAGANNGFGESASFDQPRGIAVYGGICYIADFSNRVIRKIEDIQVMVKYQK
jgi:sugar lactone lactonase YvrE